MLPEEGWSPHLEALLNPTLLHSHTGGAGLPVGNEGLGWAFHHSLPLQILPAPAQVRQISLNTYVSLTSTHISDFSCVISLEKGHVYLINLISTEHLYSVNLTR